MFYGCRDHLGHRGLRSLKMPKSQAEMFGGQETPADCWGPEQQWNCIFRKFGSESNCLCCTLWILCSLCLNKESVISSLPADQLALSFWVLPRFWVLTELLSSTPLQPEHADLPPLDILLKFLLCPRLLLRLNPTKAISCSSTGKPPLKLLNDSLRFSWEQMIEHRRRNNYRRSSGWKCLDRSSMEWRFCRHQVIALVTSSPLLFFSEAFCLFCVKNFSPALLRLSHVWRRELK